MDFDLELLDRFIAELKKRPSPSKPLPGSLRRARLDFVNELSRFPNLMALLDQKAEKDCNRSDKDIADQERLRQRALAVPTDSNVDAMCVIAERDAGKPSMGFYRLKELCNDDDALDCLVKSFGGAGIDSVLPALETLRRRIDQLDSFALSAVAKDTTLNTSAPPQLAASESPVAKTESLHNAGNEPPEPPYLNLKLDSDKHSVHRDDQRLSVKVVELPATLCWPVFKAVFLKSGEGLSSRELNELPGSTDDRARRKLRSDINQNISPLSIEITPDWRLIPSCEQVLTQL